MATIVRIALVCLGFPLFGSASWAQDTFTDPRDGQIYPVVLIEDAYWFAANLNFATEHSECYQDTTIACGDWGRLYPIKEFQEVCPTGWRLPNRADWLRLENIIHDSGVFALLDGTHWRNAADSSNATGLSLVPSGFKHRRKFLHQYFNSTIWFNDSTAEGSNWHFHTDGNNNEEPYYFHTHEEEVYVRKFAVRCVCDKDQWEQKSPNGKAPESGSMHPANASSEQCP